MEHHLLSSLLEPCSRLELKAPYDQKSKYNNSVLRHNKCSSMTKRKFDILFINRATTVNSSFIEFQNKLLYIKMNYQTERYYQKL